MFDIGPPIGLMAVGLILWLAVTATIAGISIQTIGLILFVIGVVWLVIELAINRPRRTVATRERVVRTVLLQGATIGVIGVAVGLAAAAVFTRTLRNFVYGVSTLDPATFAVVSVMLIAVATIASVMPALRAVRLNPIAALRE